MKVSFSENLPRRAAGVCIALLVGVFMPSSKAMATCGSQAKQHTDPHLGSAFLDPALLGEPQIPAEPSDKNHAPSSPIPRRRCSGPTCSQAPLLPPLPVMQESRLAEPWAYFDPIVDLPTMTSTFLSEQDGKLLPADRTTSIFHPPRATA